MSTNDLKSIKKTVLDGNRTKSLTIWRQIYYNQFAKRNFQGPKELINPLSANPTKWSNTLKQFVGNSRGTV